MKSRTRQAMQSYQKAQVESASPEKLVLMLYDGAIQKLSLALTCLDGNDVSEFHNHVVRVQKIISELLNALDHETGGEIAVNLTRLYDYMLRRLALALLRKEPEIVTEVRTLLEELREAWKGAVEELTRAVAAADSKEKAEPDTNMNQIQAKALEPVMAGLNIQG